MEPPFRTIDGLRIRCADSGGAEEPEPVLLLTSPCPESVLAFASMWATLWQSSGGASDSALPNRR
jgi:hypothetical protein